MVTKVTTLTNGSAVGILYKEYKMNNSNNNTVVITGVMAREFRDIRTTSPKVCIRKIECDSEEFTRDHTYIPLTHQLERECAKIRGNVPVLVQFEATVSEYVDRRGIVPTKQTLTKIKNVRILGRA